MIMGTIGYMSPEQARGRKEIDQRSDIFSFGCVLFEAATGRTPFNGDSVIDTLHKITHAPAPSIRDLNPHAPSELQRIVRRCLQKDVDERYQTIKDVAIELRELRREMHTEAEIDYSISPQKRAATSNENENETKFLPANKDQTAEADALTAAPQSTSSAEYITGEIKRHKGPFAIVLTIVFLAAISFGYWFYFHRSAPTGTNQINSIAVLPFENASGNAELDYLSDGVSESVIDRLSQLPQLKVIARNSSFKYRGRNLDLKQIAEALGVDAIVTGSVVQRGDGYLMRVDVTDVRQNKQIWGKNFNRKISDVQILQSDISGEIAENLRLRLSGAQSQQLAQEGTTSPQAYEAMEKGRFFLNRVGRDNTNKAVEQFEQAIAFDPNYALAYSYLAEAYGFGGGSNLDREQRKAKRLGAALKAIELAPNLAEAHFALARIKFSGWEWAEAEREFKKAIELNPNFYRAHTGYASYLTVMGRHDEAIAEAKRSIELNPLNFLAAMTVSNAFRNARRNDEAIEAAKKALELEPNFYFTHAVLADAYEAKGMYPEALAAYHEALKRREAGGGLRIEALIGVIYAKMGERAKAVEILENLKANGDTSNEIVLLYDSLDKRDEAFAVLEQAFAERRGDLGFMRVNPKFDNLRPDPRFADLLRRMGLPQ
jgi:TolB-like protein/tetratricopeptide (TPR) repeat protein